MLVLAKYARLILLGLIACACSSEPDSPEAQIRALIETAETAAEERKPSTLDNLVARDYTDNQGHDQRSIKALIRFYLLRNQSIHLLIRIQEIQIPEPDQALAVVFVAMAGSPISAAEQLLPLRADLHRFELELRRSDDEWQIIWAHWERAGVGDFL